MSKDEIAWAIAIIGIAVEVVLATLDWWLPVPHLVYEAGSGFRVIKAQ